jgi:octaprenyl-diphosphate synthase
MGSVVTTPTAKKHVPSGSLFACIEEDLARVEERLLAETRSDIGAVRDISGHTLLSGGKRLRPAVAFLAARTVGREVPNERATAAAAAAEMIHMATLMHDDVVDSARERRGRPTANSVFGNGITVLTGDFLLAKSISLLAHNDDNLQVVRVFSDVTVAMAEGEVLQAAVAHDPETTAATYEAVIERKTARFLAGCCETGAMLGAATRAEVVALRSYGHHMGMAFQIADDLLDLLGDPKKTGKPLGTDLRDGRVTLPLIHALETADADTRTFLTDVIRRTTSDDLTDADIAAVTAAIARHGGFEAARQAAEARAELAVAELACFPASPYCATLENLARFVVARDR